MNFKTFAFILTLLLTFQSCTESELIVHQDEPTPTSPEIFDRLAELIHHEKVPTDTLSFLTAENDTVQGTFGTTIYLPANSCSGTGGIAVPPVLYVVLREYLTKDKMFWGNVQTESDQNHLVTGGNFWWKIIDENGNEFQLTSPSGVLAEMPVSLDMGDYFSNAQYFRGTEFSSDGQDLINWTLGGNSQEAWMSDENSIFNIYGLDLYWTNCDAFYNYDGVKTQFRTMLRTDATIEEGEEMVILFPDDYPSVINIYTREDDYFVTYEESILMGLTGTLVGLALDTDGNLYLGSLDINVVGDDEFTINVAQGTVEELETLITELTE